MPPRHWSNTLPRPALRRLTTAGKLKRHRLAALALVTAGWAVFALVRGSADVSSSASIGCDTSRALASITPASARSVVSFGMRSQCIQQIRRKQLDALGDIFGGIARAKWGGRVLLVDPAYHANVGDNMLTVGEIEFLRRLGWDAGDVFQCNILQGVFGALKDCGDFGEYKKVGAKLALWHAGGNWGDLYREVHVARLGTFRSLLAMGFTVVGMPQSFHYQVEKNRVEDVEKMREEISAGLGIKEEDLDSPQGRDLARSRVILTWREREAYDEARELYPFVDNRVVPDIAFQMGPFLPSSQVPTTVIPSPDSKGEIHVAPPAEKVDLLLFMRRDQESNFRDAGKRSNQYVQSYLDSLPDGKGRGITFYITDWGNRQKVFQTRDRFFSQSSVDLLDLGKVVVADRLHAAILSFLSNKPFVFVDQKTKKISRTLDVALGSWDGCREENYMMYGRAESLERGIWDAIVMLDKYSLRERPNGVNWA